MVDGFSTVKRFVLQAMRDGRVYHEARPSQADKNWLATGELTVTEVVALVDTGAVRSVISVHVLEKLGVEERGQRVAEYSDGRKDSVGVTEPIIFEMLGRDTLEEALVLGDEVLIGQTVLEKLDLLADSQGRRLIPNPAHPDQPVTKVK